LKGSQGGVRRTKVLGDFQLQADVVFSGKIASGFTRASGVDSATGVSNDTSAVSSQAGGASGEHRSIPRRNTKRAARISFDRENLTCTVRNISATGAALEGTNLARTPDDFVLVMEMESSARSCKVVWRNKSQIGVQFS
jgi:hypothetical protein